MALLTELSRSPLLIRQVDRASALPFASPSGFVMTQSTLLGERRTLLIAQDQHRVVIDAIENLEGARIEALMREHVRVAARNLRMALKNTTHLICCQDWRSSGWQAIKGNLHAFH
ncbi:DNA-binding GntR family transcriptional regulator [Bradyrhizobium sp. JR3.5]